LQWSIYGPLNKAVLSDRIIRPTPYAAFHFLLYNTHLPTTLISGLDIRWQQDSSCTLW